MSSLSLPLPTLADTAAVQALHDAAVAMLARTGMAVHDRALRETLARHHGLTVDGERVLIAPEAVASWLAAYRASLSPTPPDPAPLTPRYRYNALGYALWGVAEGGRSLRPFTREDTTNGTKLLEVLGREGVNPGVPGAPQDAPERLRPFEQYLIGAEYSSAGGQTPLISDVKTATLARELDCVYGRPFNWAVWLPNPLSFSGSTVELLWHFREQIEHVSVGSMPTMGFSAPCDPYACMALTLAEIIGGATLIHQVLPHLVPAIFPHPQPGDMRTGTLALGTPEAEVLDLLRRDVLRFYGSPWNTKMLNTSASLPNAQAQLERGQTALLGVLGGFDTFHGLGMLGIDEVFSPAQALLDLDMVNAAARVALGAETAPGLELDALPAVVDEVVRGEMIFAMHETTVHSFRRQYFLPRVLRRSDRAQWVAAGRPDAYAEAETKAAKLLNDYAFEPDRNLLAELRRVYEAGKASLA